MAFDRFMIGPFNTGLQTDTKKWQVMDDAFTYLQNAYVFRGRVRKRFGSILMGSPQSQLSSRLRIQVGTIGSPTAIPVNSSFALGGQMFSAGTQIFIPYQVGTPAAMYAPVGPGTGTYNTSTGAFVLSATGLAGGTAIYYYPALPVMGLTQYEIGAINNHPSYAFDTKFAYFFTSPSGWSRSFNAATNTPIWHGTNLNYFWTTNWEGIEQGGSVPSTVLFVTNFFATNPNGAAVPATDDPIWYYDGTNWVAVSASNAAASYVNAFYFLPAPAGTPGTRINSAFVSTAKIILPFKNRLILLNTIECDNSGTHGAGTNTNYVNRCRYSFNGSPFALNAWYEQNQSDSDGNGQASVAAGGGYIDATTDEQIIGAEFIKDRLLVFFERSTWELVYTGNEVLPFVFQKINTELGSQSTFSTVPFDKQVLAIGQSGIISCSGTNVARIDEKIPDEIFDNFELKNSATSRTAGIRDYYTEMVYWAFCEANQTPFQTFPNQVLVYNYKNGSWAVNDDTITTFGYFEQSGDMTWASSAPLQWNQIDGNWQSSITNAQVRQILAGTPEGFVIIIAPDVSENATCMQITNVAYSIGIMALSIYNHNLVDGEFIKIINLNGITINNPTTPIFKVGVLDANTITIAYITATGTYTGGGLASKVSNVQMNSKQWNPYAEKDRNFFLQRIDFIVEKNDPDPTGIGGQITVDYYPSSTSLSMIEEGDATGTIMGTSILEMTPYNPIYYPLEQYQDRLTHPLYFQCSANCIQIAMYFSDAQMVNPSISLEDFELEGMVLYCQPTGDRMQ